MNADKLNRLWLLLTAVLVLIIAAGSLVIWARHDQGQTLSISPVETPAVANQVYVSGEIANPGVYPLKPGDSLDGLILSSGGLKNDADISAIRVYIPSSNSSYAVQKIDVNRAELWLLEALPGIGEARAQSIIDYRQKNGQFKGIEELTNIPGISQGVFEKLKPYVTVGE